MRTSFFRDVTWGRREGGSRGFGTEYLSLFQGAKDSLTFEQGVDILSRNSVTCRHNSTHDVLKEGVFYFLNTWCIKWSLNFPLQSKTFLKFFLKFVLF